MSNVAQQIKDGTHKAIALDVCDNKPSLLRHLGVDGKRRSAGCDQSKVAAPLSNGLVAQAKNSKMVVRSIRKHNDHLEACEQNVFNDGSVTHDVHELRCDGLQLQLVPVLFIMSPFAGEKGEQTFACGERACYNKVKAEPQCGSRKCKNLKEQTNPSKRKTKLRGMCCTCALTARITCELPF